MAKPFLTSKVYDTGLARDWRALVVYQQLVLLMDEEGFVSLTREQLCARTGIPAEVVTAGMEVLVSGELTRKPMVDREALGIRVVGVKVRRKKEIRDNEAITEFSRQYQEKYGWAPEWDMVSMVQVRRVRALNPDLYPRIVRLYLDDPFYAKVGHAPATMGNATFLNKVKMALSRRVA
jgi:hypothetical protein